jgi:hypothetical protein
MTIRMPSALRAALEREADRQQRSVSDVMILILTEAMSKRKGR